MSYRLLQDHFRRLGHLTHVAEIMHWDEAVMMPKAAGEARADAMGTLHVMLHDMLTDPRLPDWLDKADSDALADTLNPYQVANLREMRRIVRRARALPASLVERRSGATMRCEQAWRGMRAENDWAGFLPLFEQVVAIKREEAAVLSDSLGLSPYDALMDEYEPGARAQDIDRVFADLKEFLPSFIEIVLDRQRAFTPLQPEGPFAIPAQEALGRKLMAAVGFDMAHGRLDVSHHPFCGGTPDDVRITTRYNTADFTTALLGVLHETGHGKYEQGLPAAYRGQPVGLARGMSSHEGQSLLQEMQISRSRAFLTFAAPMMAAAFPEAVQRRPETFSVDNLYRLYTRVSRSKIRVDADEVTYPCHVMLRYEIEKALVTGTMECKDVPEAWDAAMTDLLGISTKDDYRDGCMQDTHWAGGAMGYFPTYTLGAMTAAQVFAAAKRAIPSLMQEIAAGEFASVNRFLSERIWSQGCLHETDVLMRNATGAPLSADAFKAHLRARYLDDLG